MSYWWVSQHRTYEGELRGEYLWAPLEDIKGKTYAHCKVMDKIRPGDIIFSYVKQAIVAISIAKTVAFEHSIQSFRFEHEWISKGKRINVCYEPLVKPIPIKAVLHKIKPWLSKKHTPLTKDGTRGRGYIFEMPPDTGKLLIDYIDPSITDELSLDSHESLVERAIRRTISNSTTRQAVIQSRIGQGKFRADLMALWNGKCCITDFDFATLLRASHIKPWRDADNDERLDPYNGLLLSPNYDAAFDAGLITFSECGRIKLAHSLTPLQIQQLGISQNAQIKEIRAKHVKYLTYHQKNIFVDKST